jgi:hypothetical protein
LPPDHLRAGTVKARRPRVCAGGAKRSPLYGAEHGCSIALVMAVASDEKQPRKVADQRCVRHDFLDDFRKNI